MSHWTKWVETTDSICRFFTNLLQIIYFSIFRIAPHFQLFEYFSVNKTRRTDLIIRNELPDEISKNYWLEERIVKLKNM